MHMSQFEGLTAGTWVIDPTHTEIGFSVRHLMSKVRGKFEEFEGQIVVAEDPSQSSATATVQLASVNTGTKQRDDHLRSSEFFSVEDTPVMTFTTTGIKVEDGEITASGDLTIKDVTKSVDLQVEFLGVGGDPWGGTRAGFEATAVVSRKDFGITWNVPMDGGKVMVGDKITINLTVEAVLQQDAAA
jgi:polyisoprenoid-binding protein YceI